MSNPLVLNAPKRIYLQIGELVDDVPFGELTEVTWCDHAVSDNDMPYVRADLHAALEARVAALEAARNRTWSDGYSTGVADVANALAAVDAEGET